MNLYQTLKHYFGYDTLRPGQQDLMEGILNGSDVLGIMPTGAGKSLCYQVPALMLPGITIVISPLISLMSDQVKALNQAGVHAAYINSSLTENQIRAALLYAAQGHYKIIYVAPERLNTMRFLDFACRADISMVTVDEAHCISQWGQDFRPSYLEIADFLARLPRRPVVSAFTATATERVKQDITGSLHLQNPVTVVTGFDRPNLFFRVVKRKGGKETDNSILNYVKRHEDESGIIYCATKKNVDSVCELLLQHGILAGRYHAGLSLEERKESQDDFTYDRIRVMVATNAFGMGIDKSNVRYVLHYNMPQSLEYYYQEAGRAGRDGLPSFSLVMLSGRDGVAVVNRLHAAEPERHGVKGLASLLSRRGEHIVSLYEASAVHDLPDVAVDRMLFDLKRSGSVREQGMGYKYYKVRPLFRMEEILCGRDGEERSRLQWMDGHREGEVEALAAEWGISWEEAGAWLDELVLSGEWKVDLRQTALHLHSEGFDAEEAAEEFAQYFSRSRLNGLERWKTCVSTLTSSACLNRSLDAYFGFREPSGPCGHCPGCCGAVPAEMELEDPGPLPEELRSAVMELAAQRKPALARPSQLTRFLLGLASPAAMRARLWGHPLYGTLADRSWEDVWIEARALLGN